MITAMCARIATSSRRALKVSPSGSRPRLMRLLKNGAQRFSCQGEVPCASWAARIANSVTTTRPIIPSTTQAAPVCEP